MTQIGYALCKVRFYALKVLFWRGRSQFPQGAMHYEILCIISSCIMRYSTVQALFYLKKCSEKEKHKAVHERKQEHEDQCQHNK